LVSKTKLLSGLTT